MEDRAERFEETVDNGVYYEIMSSKPHYDGLNTNNTNEQGKVGGKR